MIDYSSPQAAIWRLNEIDKIIDGFDSTVSKYVKVRQIKYDYDYTNIILTMAGKSIVTMREILCLSLFGYPDGALSLSRNIYEQFIVLLFLSKKRHSPDFPQIIENYYHNYEVQRLKNTKAQYELLNLPAEYEEAKQKLITYKQNNNINKDNDYWWAGVNTFAELKNKAVEMVTDENIKTIINHMHIGYKRACVSLHASCLGNYIRLGFDQDATVIDTSPTQKGHSFPLWLSTMSMMLVVEAVCKELLINDSFHDQLFELGIFYAQKKNEEDGCATLTNTE